MDWLGPISYALPNTTESRQALLGILAGFDVVRQPENWMWYFDGATSSSAVIERSEPTLPLPVPVLDAADDKPPQWAVERLILGGDLTLIVGDGGSYKSTFALHTACAIASGSQVAGHFKAATGPTLYVSGEDGAGRLKNRAYAVAKAHGLSFDAVRNVHVLARVGASLDDPAWRDHIRACAERIGAVAIILDPLRDLSSAELNSDKDVAHLTRLFRELAELPTEPAVIVLHHSGKQREGQRTIDRAVRGASALNQAARSVLLLERKTRGVEVSQLKSTDSPLHPRFMVEIRITEGDYPGTWDTAHLKYADSRKGDCNEAKAPLLEFIRNNPGLTSTAIREQAPKEYPNLRLSGISDAMKALHEDGEIRYEKGPKNARLWEVVE